MKPKFALVTVGNTTHVFLDGRCISKGLEDVNFSARNDEGKLQPTVDLKVNIQDFALEKGQTLNDFIAATRDIKTMIGLAQKSETDFVPDHKVNP